MRIPYSPSSRRFSGTFAYAQLAMYTFETFPCLNWNNWFNAAKNGSIFEVDAETQRNFCVAVSSGGENLGIKYHDTRIGTRCQL